MNTVTVKFRDNHEEAYDLGGDMWWYTDGTSLVLIPDGVEIIIPLCNVRYWQPRKEGTPEDPLPTSPTRDYVVNVKTMNGENWDSGPVYNYAVSDGSVYVEIDLMAIDGRCVIRCYPLDAVRFVTVTDAD